MALSIIFGDPEKSSKKNRSVSFPGIIKMITIEYLTLITIFMVSYSELIWATFWIFRSKTTMPKPFEHCPCRGWKSKKIKQTIAWLVNAACFNISFLHLTIILISPITGNVIGTGGTQVVDIPVRTGKRWEFAVCSDFCMFFCFTISWSFQIFER